MLKIKKITKIISLTTFLIIVELIALAIFSPVIAPNFISNNHFPLTKEKETKKINFLFFGDLMLDRYVGDIIKQNDINWLLEKIVGEEKRFFQEIDLIGANLEGAVTDNGAHYPPEMSYDFAFAPKLIQELKNYGFNYFTIANNHITDQGATGLAETRDNLDNLNINYSGCPDKQVDNCSFKIIKPQNQRIGLLAYSMVYGTLDEDKLIEQIKNIKNQTDLIIVNMHWGVEYEYQHNLTQEQLAHKIIEAGADIIIGHHPHVVQDIEIYKNKPIFYSLGNFIFDQYFSPATQTGLAVGLIWQDNKIQINLFPHSSQNSQVKLIVGEEKKEFLSWLSDISKIPPNLKENFKNGKIELN